MDLWGFESRITLTGEGFGLMQTPPPAPISRPVGIIPLNIDGTEDRDHELVRNVLITPDGQVTNEETQLVLQAARRDPVNGETGVALGEERTFNAGWRDTNNSTDLQRADYGMVFTEDVANNTPRERASPAETAAPPHPPAQPAQANRPPQHPTANSGDDTLLALVSMAGLFRQQQQVSAAQAHTFTRTNAAVSAANLGALQAMNQTFADMQRTQAEAFQAMQNPNRFRV